MEIIVSGRHLDITDAIRQYATDKVGRLPKFFDRVQVIEVIADKGEAHDNSQQVEIIVRAEHVDPFIARAAGNDLYACIDDAVEKLERQLREHKDKVRNRKHVQR